MVLILQEILQKVLQDELLQLASCQAAGAHETWGYGLETIICRPAIANGAWLLVTGVLLHHGGREEERR